eukprot:2079810-Pleurochrysis_carterae.AAC.1
MESICPKYAHYCHGHVMRFIRRACSPERKELSPKQVEALVIAASHALLEVGHHIRVVVHELHKPRQVNVQI